MLQTLPWPHLPAPLPFPGRPRHQLRAPSATSPCPPLPPCSRMLPVAAGLRAARRRRPRLDVVGSPAAPKAGPRGAETGPGGELLPQPPARGCGHGRRKELPSSPAGGFGAGKASPAAAGAAPSARLLALSCSPSASTRRWGTEKPFPRARPARSRSRLRSASSENKRGKGKWWDPALCCISLLGCMAEGEEER